MSYTNSTPNLHLPQYIATDKPTYLGDWNASMQTIDTVITSTQATADGASSTAISANATAQAAQQTANSATQKANTNSTQIENIKSFFTTTTLIATPASNISSNITVQYNDFLLSVYGNCSQSGSKPLGTVVDTNTRIPLFSFPGNPLKLEASLITDSNNKKSAGPVIISADTKTHYSFATFFYDGANTTCYFYITTSIYNEITKLNSITIDSVSLINIE